MQTTAWRAGGFDAVAPLARGGMGEVWQARRGGVPVAIKVVGAEHARSVGAIEAFRSEVRAVARLDHPNVVRLLDHGVVDAVAEATSGGRVVAGSPWVAMELAHGGSLLSRCGSVSWAEARELLLALLSALGHAHARGVVHRDIKPANVLAPHPDDLRPGPRLADFGISRALGAAGPDRVAGTPQYMAPEQRAGRVRAQGPWTDLFALGRTAAALLAGDPEAPPSSLPAPPGFAAWLARMTATEPEERFRFAADAAWSLARIDGEPVAVAAPARRPAREAPSSHTWTFDEALPVLIDADAERCAVEPAPVPADWRQPGPAEAAALANVGLGLYGLRPIPLVGREAERDVLWSALREVTGSGRPRAVALIGGAGFGKSRLAEWLCERAAETGAAHAVSASWKGPEDDALGRLAARLGCQGPFGSPGERSAAIWQALVALGRERAVVVWLDDVHHAPDAMALAAWGEEGRVSFVLTARDDLLAERPEAARALEALRRGGAALLEVGPLDDAHRAALVRGLLGLDGELATRVEGRTAGNPLFAVQLVGDWVHRGVLAPGEGGFRLVADDSLPDDLYAVWSAALDRVLADHPGGREALELAALLGGTVIGAEWRAACEAASLPADDELVDRLMHRRLARDEGPGAWAFAHGMLRETLARAAADAGRAPRLHGACARALAAGRAAPERIGYHRLEAGDLDEAAELLLEGARSLGRRGTPAVAVMVLDRCARALDGLGAPASDERRGRLALRRGDLLLRVGDLRGGLASFEALLAEARAWGWAALVPEILGLMAPAVRFVRSGEEARPVVAELIAEATAAGALDWLAVGLLERALGLVTRGDYEPALEAAARALEVAERAPEPTTIARACYGGGHVAMAAGREELARERFTRGISAYEALSATAGAATARMGLADLELGAGRVEASRAHLLEAREAFERTRNGNVVVVDYKLGLTWVAADPERARPCFERAMQEGVRRGWTSVASAAATFVAAAAAEDGDTEACLRAMGHVVGGGSHGPDALLVPPLLRVAAHLEAVGRAEAARARELAASHGALISARTGP